MRALKQAWDSERKRIEAILREVKRVTQQKGFITHALWVQRVRLRAEAGLLYRVRWLARMRARAGAEARLSALKPADLLPPTPEVRPEA